jgi:hypothetical protein
MLFPERQTALFLCVTFIISHNSLDGIRLCPWNCNFYWAIALSPGRITLTRENLRIRWETRPSVTWPTINSSWGVLGLKLCLRCEKPITNCLSYVYGTAIWVNCLYVHQMEQKVANWGETEKRYCKWHGGWSESRSKHLGFDIAPEQCTRNCSAFCRLSLPIPASGLNYISLVLMTSESWRRNFNHHPGTCRTSPLRSHTDY